MSGARICDLTGSDCDSQRKPSERLGGHARSARSSAAWNRFEWPMCKDFGA